VIGAPSAELGALVKKLQHASLIDTVADRQHVVAVRYIERLRARNQRRQIMGRAGDVVLGADAIRIGGFSDENSARLMT